MAKTEVESRKDRLDNAVSLYKEMLEIPTVNRALFLPSKDEKTLALGLQVESFHRSMSSLKKSKATQSFTLGSNDQALYSSPLTFTDPNVLHVAYSSKGETSAVFRVLPKEDEKPKRLLLEHWSTHNGRKLGEIDLTEEHGDVFFDDTFGYPSWNTENTTLVFSAQPAKPKEPDYTEKFRYVPDFGEKFQDIVRSDVYVVRFNYEKNCDCPPATFFRITNSKTLDGASFAQPAFLFDDIVATVYSALPDSKKLGLIYCTNRKSMVCRLSTADISSNCLCAKGASKDKKHLAVEELSPKGRSARSPRVFITPNKADEVAQLVFISNAEGGPHNSCAQLHHTSVKKSAIRQPIKPMVLIDTVDSAPPSAFPGLFVDQLPVNPFLWLKEHSYVTLTSFWQSQRVVLLIRLDEGSHTVERVFAAAKIRDDPILPYATSGGGLESSQVLGTDGCSRIITLTSTPSSPAKLSIVRVNTPADLNAELSFSQVPILLSPMSTDVTDKLSTISYTILPLPKFEPSEIVLVSPIPINPAAESSWNLPPLITIPHGGPHSASTTDFSAQVAALVIAGYRVALINYPGSIGFGQKFVESLAPEVGKLDVEATLGASHYLNTISLASRTKGKKLLMGGSHGGYISTHLSGSYPDHYDAVVLRNPVVDLPSMLFATDIPDWTYAETNLPYLFGKPPSTLTPEIFQHLHDRSPMRNVANVVIPTLLLIGEVDRRVPPDQGRNWYHALKGLGKVDVDMLNFPKNSHAIDSTVEAELVSFEAGLRWLANYTDF